MEQHCVCLHCQKQFCQHGKNQNIQILVASVLSVKLQKPQLYTYIHMVLLLAMQTDTVLLHTFYKSLYLLSTPPSFPPQVKLLRKETVYKTHIVAKINLLLLLSDFKDQIKAGRIKVSGKLLEKERRENLIQPNCV